MKCNVCNRSINTAGQVKNCDTCKTDGTAGGIGFSTNSDEALDGIVANHSGLANRFTPEAEPLLVEQGEPEENPGIVKRITRAAKKLVSTGT